MILGQTFYFILIYCYCLTHGNLHVYGAQDHISMQHLHCDSQGYQHIYPSDIQYSFVLRTAKIHPGSYF